MTKLFTIIIIFCLININWALSFAQNAKEEYKKIQKDIMIHKKKLESIKKVETSVIEELKRTNLELTETENQLRQQKDKIKKIQKDIATLQKDIDLNKKNLEYQNSLLINRLRSLQKNSRINDALLIVISGEDFSQTLRLLRYLNEIAGYDQKIINIYKESLEELNSKQENLKRLFSDLKSAEKKLIKLEDSLKEKKKERESLLASVQKERRSYEKMIKELKENSNRLQKIIEESEKKEYTRKKKKETKDDSSKLPENGFSSLKGRLPWPVNGTVVIPYGQQVDPVFNLPVFRSGIHIKTSPDATVKAIYEGKVVFADEFKGYGQLVIISHGDGYFTLYGNLSRIFLKNGAIIKENTIIGEVGESATIGANGLYFEIRYKGKPLNPQQWLRKT
jgi:septal ring factor EnvC (AmiA/AmiB activator)